MWFEPAARQSPFDAQSADDQRARLVGYTKVCSTLILGCPVDRRNLPAMGHDRESHPDMRGVLSSTYWYRLAVALVKKIRSCHDEKLVIAMEPFAD